ncbi:orotate phosphoribosyltransferase [Auricularia subglabra TFB-10046 SS5]|uniref:orotate phosphoribosyltransferase n=1 Tax=Auricularia subglabra (strain TFB-10046 / SS5) TaxID=717982 RepID=J0DBK6_AURST|nr:orotate phosphoribosyltransferase [Auricularia subglabra TFB-10046 SS5]
MASPAPAQTATPALSKVQQDLIDGSFAARALRFGSFTLKSGRISPYFFNAGELSTGPLISTLATGYAAEIAALGVQFDVLFGPAYKGIPLAAATALALHREHGIDVGYAFDRKEAKDHGEGGRVVGAPLKGKRVLVLDDVMTSGKAVRISVDTIRAQGGEVVGAVLLLDREEVGPDGVTSTVEDLRSFLAHEVVSLLKMRHLITWLEKRGDTESLQAMNAYRQTYGIKHT